MSSELIVDSPTPMYVQLERILRAKIESGEYDTGSALPTELELMESYRVSRTTVRQALDRLAKDNTIVRVQGKGTFVGLPEIKQDLATLRTISEVLTGAGLEPTVQVLGMEINPPLPPHVRPTLALAPEVSVIRIRRRHLVDGEPIAYAVIYLSGRHNWRFSAEELAHQSIYSWLEEKSEISVASGQQVIKALAAEGAVSELLSLPVGAPVLYVENTSFTKDRIPIEYTEFYFPADRYAFTVTLRRAPAGDALGIVDAGLADSAVGAG